MKVDRRLLYAAAILALLFAWFVWPTLWAYYGPLKVSDRYLMLMRRNRITNSVEVRSWEWGEWRGYKAPEPKPSKEAVRSDPPMPTPKYHRRVDTLEEQWAESDTSARKAPLDSVVLLGIAGLLIWLAFRVRGAVKRRK